VTALIFFLLAIAMMLAIGGSRGIAAGLFGISLVMAVVWFNHHVSDPLTLAF
jgi:hypothetical protein